MNITVEFFGSFAQSFSLKRGNHSFKVELKRGDSLSNLLQKLNFSNDVSKVILINGRPFPGDELLHEGDIVSIFPRIVGG